MAASSTSNKHDWQLISATLYLSIPNIFFGYYYSLPAFIISLVATMFVVATVAQKSHETTIRPTGSIVHFLLLPICVAWVFLSGMTGQIYTNPDWPVRLTVLNDLIQNEWPIIYQHENDSYFLRAPIGHYLPSAFTGKLFGSYTIGLWSLFAWGVVGSYIALNIAIKNYGNRKALIGIAIIIFFSGLDIIGFLIRRHGVFDWGNHLEWWASRWQYSSNTTLLFWVPNHTLAAWIFTGLMMRKENSRSFWLASPLLLAMTLTFSPLSFIGSTALYCLYYFKKIIGSLKSSTRYQLSALIATTLFAIGAQYIASDLTTISKPEYAIEYSLLLRGVGYLFFILFEFAFLALLVRPYVKEKRWLKISGILLVFMPLLPSFGPGNDLVMRASIAPLFCFCILAIEALLSEELRQHYVRKFLIAVTLLVGAITPAQEFIRPWTLTNNKFIPKVNLYEFTNGEANHYYVRKAP